MTQTMASPTGDPPLYTYIDMTASHPMALSLSYTMHPPYVTGQVSRRTSQNTLSPSWATSGARSPATIEFGKSVPLYVGTKLADFDKKNEAQGGWPLNEAPVGMFTDVAINPDSARKVSALEGSTWYFRVCETD